MASSGPKTRTRAEASPFRFDEGGLDFAVTEFRLDGKGSGTPDNAEREVPLDQWSDWDVATLELAVGIDDRVVEYVFPDDDQSAPPGKLVVSMQCSATHWRDCATVAEGPITAGEYVETVGIDRENVRESLELRAWLVRTDSRSPLRPYRTNEGLRLADDESWTVHIDERDGPADDSLPTTFESFGEEGIRPEENLYELSFKKPDEPLVLVNKDHQPVVDVLKSGGYNGFRPRMREVVAGEIGVGVWTQLLHRTALTVHETGDCEYEWQEGVVHEFEDVLFDSTDPLESAAELGERLDDSETASEALIEVNSAAQRYVTQSQRLNKHIRKDS